QPFANWRPWRNPPDFVVVVGDPLSIRLVWCCDHLCCRSVAGLCATEDKLHHPDDSHAQSDEPGGDNSSRHAALVCRRVELTEPPDCNRGGSGFAVRRTTRWRRFVSKGQRFFSNRNKLQGRSINYERRYGKHQRT